MPMHIGVRVEIFLGRLGYSRWVLPCVVVLVSKHFLEVDFYSKVLITHSLSGCFFFLTLSLVLSLRWVLNLESLGHG